eukprot:COSAG03_NODE_936_length_5265_cov_20.249322_2_plen_81_part_00
MSGVYQEVAPSSVLSSSTYAAHASLSYFAMLTDPFLTPHPLSTLWLFCTNGRCEGFDDPNEWVRASSSSQTHFQQNSMTP